MAQLAQNRLDFLIMRFYFASGTKKRWTADETEAFAAAFHGNIRGVNITSKDINRARAKYPNLNQRSDAQLKSEDEQYCTGQAKPSSDAWKRLKLIVYKIEDKNSK